MSEFTAVSFAMLCSPPRHTPCCVFCFVCSVELLAPDVEQCCRWVRALNSRGIKTVQQSKRMSVVNEVAAPVGQAKSAPVAAPVAAPIKS